jgi:basic membrane protein A
MNFRVVTKSIGALAAVALLMGTIVPATAFSTCEVTDTGGVDDKSFNQTAWKGVEDAQ